MNIFISYSRCDSARAEEFVTVFNQLGVTCWLDRKSVQVGEIWREEVVKGITESDLFLILLSADSIISDSVRRELDIAESCHKRIIPVMIEEVKIPPQMQYQLAGVNYILLQGDVPRTVSAILSAYQGATAAPAIPAPPVQNAKATSVSKRAIREKLMSNFSIKELSELCFEIEGLLEAKNIRLQLNLDVLGGQDQGKDALILELIGFLDRRGYLKYLEQGIESLRPGIFAQ